MIKHLAIIMDGNRRWAKKQGLPTWRGHQQGSETIEHAITFCLDNQIRYLTLYAFSLENLQRSAVEREHLYSLIAREAERMIPECKKRGVRIKFIGDRSLFPQEVSNACSLLEAETAMYSTLQVNILFCYGARQEIFFGVKELVRKIQAGELNPDELTPEVFENCLWLHGIPEPELIIRTGGKKRLSNFLLYQAAYSEMLFLDCLWPEVTKDHFQAAVSSFEAEQRNFGV